MTGRGNRPILPLPRRSRDCKSTQSINIDLSVVLRCVVVVIVVVISDPMVACGDDAGCEAIRTTQIAVVQEAKIAHIY